ncbi:MAG: glycosyltransferase family 4 protein [Demequina sp.]
MLRDVGSRVRVRAALDMAEALAKENEAGLALALIEGALDRYPRSSQVFVARAVTRKQFGRHGVADDLVAACAGDLRSIGLDGIAGAALTVLDVAELDALETAIRGAARGPDSGQQAAVAFEVLRIAEGYRRGEPLELDAGGATLPREALVAFATWARRDLRWDDIDRLIDELGRRESAGYPLERLRVQLAEMVRARGDLTQSLELIQPVAKRSQSSRSVRLVNQNLVDLGLLKNGWPTPMSVPKASAADGAMAYLLHNSLPYTSGGYATRTHGLLASMARRGWRVDAITRPQYPADRPEGASLSKRELEAGSVIDRVRYSRILEGSPEPNTEAHIDHFARCVAQRARREQWGVIHAASNHFVGLAAVEAAARVGVPSVYEVRGLWEITRKSREPHYELTERYAMTARLEADACRHADHSFAITEGLRSLMIDRGVPEDHISLLPNGVDVNRFTPSPPNEELRKQLGLEGKIVIGYVGSVLDYEGIELLVDAVRLLVDAGLPVALLIVGDGKAFDSVKRRVVEAGVGDHVVLPGRVPHAEAEAYYTLIDIAPFPRLPLTVTELVSPLKPFEAMAMGKPVVVSSVAALTEIVSDGVNGRVFVKGDVESLAATLTHLVEDEDERSRLGAAGREWVVANRSWDTLSARIVDTYQALGVPFPRADRA